MRKLILLSVLFWFSFNSYAQIQMNILPKRPYEPLVFKDLTPIWYETLYDPTFIGGDSCDGYNLFRRSFDIPELFDEDHVYKIFIKFGVYQDNGTYIEKRNLRTGQQVWMTYFGLPVDDRQEFGRVLSFDANGNIEVISQLKRTPYLDKSDYLFSFKTVLSKRVYDKDTGELIDHYKPDIQDDELIESSFSSWINYDNFYKTTRDSFNYFHFRFENNLNDVFYVLSAVHLKSKNSDTTQYTLKEKELYTLMPFAPIDENEILIIERENGGNRLLLRYTDFKLNVVREFYTDSINNFLDRVLFESYDPENETILLVHSENSNLNGTPEQRELILLNKEGKILKRGKLPGRYGGSFGVLSGNNHKKIKLIASENVFPNPKEINIFLDILDMAENGTLTRFKRYTPVDSVRFVSLFKIFHVLDDKLLMSWWERSYSNDNGQPHFDTRSSAMSWVLFDKNEFGLNTNQKNEFSEILKVYPNPVSDFLTISSDKTLNGNIKIFNDQGLYIHSHKIENMYNTSIDVSHLKSGSYNVYFQSADTNKTYSIRKIIKI